MRKSIEKISSNYKNSDLMDIIANLNKEVMRLKQMRSRNDEQTEYLNASKEVLFFLRHGIKPAALDQDSFFAMKPLIQFLVDKGQLKKEVMSLFSSSD